MTRANARRRVVPVTFSSIETFGGAVMVCPAPALENWKSSIEPWIEDMRAPTNQ
jgi:hypothetical protein